mgnify:CR=1 FL=1
MWNLCDLKGLLVRICHLIAEKDYVSAMDGNVSVRLSDGTFLCTPTMIHKAFITEADLLVVDARGQKLYGAPDRAPTSEIHMHLAAYACRPDVHAVVHAHPPTAIAFTLAGETLARCVLPEVVLTLGQIPTAPYATTGTHALADIVGALIATHDALLLERHGAICVGRDLIDAFGKLEKVEHTALITLRARMLGRARTLDCDEVTHLRDLGQKYSSNGRPPPMCEDCGGCPTQRPWQDAPSFSMGRVVFSDAVSASRRAPATSSTPDSTGWELKRLVTDEILRTLDGR